MNWYHIILLLLWLNHCSFFQVERGKDSDVISGPDISNFCGSESTCQCPNTDSAGQTFIDSAGPDMCTDGVAECELMVEDEENNLHNLFTVEIKSASQTTHSIMVVKSDNTSVCATNNPSASPIFIRDNQNNMVWNANWSPDFKNRVLVSKIEDKVQLNMSTHWSGLLVKIYVDCGTAEQCVAVKFAGTQQYPLQEQAVSSILGPPLPEPTSIFSSLTSTTMTLSSIQHTTISHTRSSTIQQITTSLQSSLQLSPSSQITSQIRSSQITSQITSSQITSQITSLLKSTSLLASASSVMKTSLQSSSSETPPQLSSLSVTLPPSSPSKSITTPSESSVGIVHVIHSSSSVKSPTTLIFTSPAPQQGKLLDENDDKFMKIFISLSVLLLLILLIIFIIWLCKRRRRKIKIEEERKRNRLRVEYASIKYLNNGANGSISSAAAVLNSQRMISTEGFIEENVLKDNPVYELSDGAEEDTPRKAPPLPPDRKNSATSNIEIRGDNPRFSDDSDIDENNPTYMTLEKSQFGVEGFYDNTDDDDTMFHFNHNNSTGSFDAVKKVRRHSLDTIKEDMYNVI